MDKTYVKSAIDGLKSTSSSRIQESLIKIRSTIISNEKGVKIFRDSGGIELLIPHLRKPNEKILDITLSILGNVCLEEKSSLLVGKLNCFGSLVTILSTVYRDSLLGRTCRVIGNLAQYKSNAEGLHAYGAVKALVTLIENRDKNTSYPTLTMAVRAIRLLWMVQDKRDEMLTLNAIRCVSILLTTECESMGIIKSSSLDKEIEAPKKSQDELIIGILKCLGYFTTYSIPQCAEQIQGDGRGYQCLVALTKNHESLALKCLMNLCYLSSSRPLLGIAGLVECLVGILQKHTDVSYWPEGAAKALAQLSGESMNRSRLRHCGGLPLLMAAARSNAHALHALLQYVFDDTSFKILINEGIVGLLTEKLADHISTMEYDHNIEISDDKNEPFKRKERTKSEPNSVYNAALQNLTATYCNMSNEKMAPNRRKSLLLTETRDELKVIIERDNMIVGFVDAIDSGESDESECPEEEPAPPRRKALKRPMSRVPEFLKVKSQLLKMASKDWSAGVYWEPKSPEWPFCSQPSSNNSKSPERDSMPMSPISDGNGSGFSPDYRGSSSKRARLDWSPESGFSTGEGSCTSPYRNEFQWSPCSSGPTSPLSTNYDDTSDSELSGRYSPVCSEPDALEEHEKRLTSENAVAELKAAQVAHDLDELIMDDEDSNDEDIPSEEFCKGDVNSKSSGIACVMVLLFRVSHGVCTSCGDMTANNNALDLLTGKECINGLLDYVERCRQPMGRAARILARVLSNALCLMSILKHRLALRLHYMSMNSKHPPSQCSQCKQILKLCSKFLTQLAILAESSYGIGEISYQLLKGSSAMKQTLSLTLPYIVRAEKALKKYLIDCNALNILFNIIAESKEKIQDCVVALAKLATNVHIKDPKVLETRYKDYVTITYDPILDNLTSESIVIFELDDLSTVKADKTFLCQHSEVFSAMLMGRFKESNEKCVRLKNVSKPALEYLFTLLLCGLNNSKCDIEIFPMAEHLETNLEVLLLADRFLFDKLKELLSSAILQFKLGPETADKIYIWSLGDGMGFLCVESVAYLLTGKMTEAERIKSFTNILSLKYKEQWLEDIKTMLLRQLVK